MQLSHEPQRRGAAEFFIKFGADETKARAYLEFLRWGDAGAVCPHCGGDQPYTITPKAGSKTRKGLYKCRACRKQFTVTWERTIRSAEGEAA